MIIFISKQSNLPALTKNTGLLCTTSTRDHCISWKCMSWLTKVLITVRWITVSWIKRKTISRYEALISLTNCIFQNHSVILSLATPLPSVTQRKGFTWFLFRELLGKKAEGAWLPNILSKTTYPVSLKRITKWLFFPFPGFWPVAFCPNCVAEQLITPPHCMLGF